MAIQFRPKKKSVPTTPSAKINRARAFPRANLPGRVYIHDEERLFIAPLDNISAGGIFIEGLTSFPQGRDVKIVVKVDKLIILYLPVASKCSHYQKQAD